MIIAGGFDLDRAAKIAANKIYKHNKHNRHIDYDDILQDSYMIILDIYDRCNRSNRQFNYHYTHLELYRRLYASVIKENKYQARAVAADAYYISSLKPYRNGSESSIDDKLYRALTHLSDDERTLLMLRFTMGLTVKQVAEAMCICESNARKQLDRIYKRVSWICDMD